MTRPSTAAINEVLRRLEAGDERVTRVTRELYREMAAKGGRTKTPQRAAASRDNGKAGGRPSRERIAAAEALLEKMKKSKGAEREKLWNQFMETATRCMVRQNWTPDLPRPAWL